MTDPTSLSTLQSLLDEEKSLNKNSPSPTPKAFELSEIPVFTTASKSPTNPMSSMEQSLCTTTTLNPESDETTKHEYEFTFLYENHLSCVHLYDTSDVSACERVLHRPVKPEEITLSESGNGFIVDGDFRFTFTKNPYKRTYIEVKPTEKPKRRMEPQSAADVLAGL
jgi:hypothetical protein